ncbi:MAG TPA: hypothetical protein DCS21_10620 [Gammaproteobacteria bacterium]|nr:hypothetical protein [Gammaproteobacteria bacterium]
MSVMSIGVGIVQTSMENLKGNAHKIATVQSIQPLSGVGEQSSAQTQAPEVDLTEQVIDMNENTYQFKAGIFTMQTGKTIFDSVLAIA